MSSKNMKQYFILANLFIAFFLLVCVTGEEVTAESTKIDAKKSRPEQTFRVPVLVLRQGSGGSTDYAWQWVEWPAFKPYQGQIEQMIGNFRPYTSQWSQIVSQIPGFTEFFNQQNQIGSQLTGTFEPSQFLSQVQGLGR